MRLSALLTVLALAAPAFAAEDDGMDEYRKCLARKAVEPNLICFPPEKFDTKPPSAIQLVMPRNAAVKKDVETTGDHLEDATKRAR
jgi:hypothetical protein